MQVSVGWSSVADAATAGQQATRIALTRLGQRQAAGVILFGSSWYDQEQLARGAQSICKTTPVVGGSTAGEITPAGPKTHSCVAMAIAGDHLVLGAGIGSGLDRDARLAGYHAAQQAIIPFHDKPRHGMLFFGDGLLTGYADALRGIQEVLGTSSLVTGALMADDLRYAKTWQYANGKPHSQSLVGVLFGGSCQIGIGMQHGFSPISKPWQVTRASRNVLYELDGRPAASMYEEYFGASAAKSNEGLSRGLVAYPLGIQHDAAQEFLLRNVMAFGDKGSLVCTGEMTAGSWVQLMIGSKALALEAATIAARDAIRGLRQVHAVLVFDSTVRKRLLGQDTATEIARIRQEVGLQVPIAGCYTYGEQAPFGGTSRYGGSSLQTGACLVIALGQ